MESKFYKVGDTLSFKPNTQGLESNLENGTVYNIVVDRYQDTISLKETHPLQLPAKVYSTERDDKFVNKVINAFNNSEKGFTGAMLTGLKGSGKTITAKRIANSSSLPIISINNWVAPRYIERIIENVGDTSICFLFDEFDKLSEDYNVSALLKILDGVPTCGKHMIIFTCNDDEDINEYLKDRCSRIRYWRDFDCLSTSMINEVLEDKLNDKKEVKSLTDFILSNFETVSFDNVLSFVEEVNANPTDTFEELFTDMNLASK